MNPLVTIKLPTARFRPGAAMHFSVELEPFMDGEIPKTEVSVCFQTRGKGDTDTGVVLFDTIARSKDKLTKSYSLALPILPLSYEGKLISIAWMVRVRVPGALEEFVVDEPFVLAEDD